MADFIVIIDSGQYKVLDTTAPGTPAVVATCTSQGIANAIATALNGS